MKAVLGIILGLIALVAGVAVLMLWDESTIKWLIVGALAAAGIALIVTSFIQAFRRPQDGPTTAR